MSERVNVYQNKNTISVPRANFLNNIVYCTDLNKKEIRVALLLLTELDGWDSFKTRSADPQNFKSISFSKMAESLALSKKEVKEAVSTLVEKDILEIGSGNSTKNGYRFMF